MQYVTSRAPDGGPAARPGVAAGDTEDLVVLSHLRWVFVWQRPQHLVSRLAARYRTWFVEEPVPGDVDSPTLRAVRDGVVTRVWLEVPAAAGASGFDDDRNAVYARALDALLGPACRRTVWMYTPMALSLATALQPATLVYDVMDDLAAFRGAARGLAARQRQAVAAADLVFTGGRSLHRQVLVQRDRDVHLFASGVEPQHYRRSRLRAPGARPVAGYVGVIDERLDLELLAGLAGLLPDWDLRIVGPVAKIDDADLPQAPNLHYTGPRSYAELPDVMAGFDVALMPFALNAATRSISPTKTLEYLAAGLPVVSTPVRDVVADFEELVDLQGDAAGFAEACRRLRQGCPPEHHARVAPVLELRHWDAIAARMVDLLARTTTRGPAARATAVREPA